MTTQFAKENILIEDYLSWKGCVLFHYHGVRIYYSSPFRNTPEKSPSLSVNPVDQRWIDWGLDGSDGLPIMGSVVDLAYRFCGSIEGGLKDLALFYGNIGTIDPLKIYNCESKHNLKQSQSLIVTRDTHIQMRSLLAYAESRHIDREVLDEYCREVWYKNRPASKEHFSIGIRNVEGGWELSSPGFKCSTSPKAYSFFGKESNAVLVFEGMFDMLSWVMHAKFLGHSITHDILCLNSVANVKKALPKLSEYEKVNLFLDNDSAGTRATAFICASCKEVKDYRYWYAPYKDVNEWWCKTLELCGIGNHLFARRNEKTIDLCDY